MATITRVDLVHINTDKGPLYIPAVYVEEDVSSGYLFNLNDQLQDIEQSLVGCYYNDTANYTLFTATHFSFELIGGSPFINDGGDGCWGFNVNAGNYAMAFGIAVFGANNSKRFISQMYNVGATYTTTDVTIIERNTSSAFGTFKIGDYRLYVDASSSTQGWELAVVNDIEEGGPATYDWKAWTILQGNGGQYRSRLTALKDDSIGNIGSGNYGTQNDFIFISPNVDMVPYARNMNYDSPVVVAWSGINWMTMTLVAEQGLLTNQVKAVFKLYAKNSSETVPIYQETHYFFIGSTNHFYLRFVYDDENMAGVFLPVYYTVGSTGTPFSWGSASPSDSDMLLIWQWLQASGSPDPDPIPSGPYDNGTTDGGGGGGNPTPQDDIHTPNVPALGGMASGMFTVYCPTDIQLGNIAAWLWTDNFIDNVKKYFANASDNIIAFYVLPHKPANLPKKNFKVGNLENSAITEVEYLTSRFVSIDMGSLQVNHRWETYLDFSPFTKFNLYLPGVGIVALDSDDIMSPANMDGSLPEDLGSTLSLTYVLDLMTGTLVAYVKINGQIRYQFPGKMGYSIPLTGQNYTNMGTGFVTAMAGLATTIASGGTAAPFTAGAAAAGIVNAMKPDVYRGGNLSGDASMLSLKTPYLIRSSPNKPLLENQPAFSGAPSYKIDTLSHFGGFTQVIEAHIEGFSCTDAERDEIMQLLRSGVII